MLPPKLIGILLAYLDAVVRKIKGVQELMSIMTIDIYYSGRSSAAHLHPPPPDIGSGGLTGVSKDKQGTLPELYRINTGHPAYQSGLVYLPPGKGRKGKGVRRIESSILAGNDQQ
ncbi:hypothetical protein CEXT_714581 [Caerostris extrusa]|uniref:Uncharacterized protein n=1 Tax=Caerostris extrusa TaxID=172846 RepID=A0AAV4PMJ7_CAEEX|nr:hypothetical protein CEXT_714581 [Caerostris extrusa]